MQTQCNPDHLQFQPLGRRQVRAHFDGGTITSDAGGLLLREVELANRCIQEFAACFHDARHPSYTEHSLQSLIAQRVMGICLGYEDLNDHDRLRFDPLFASLCGQPDPTGTTRRRQRDQGAALAGKSTLNRLELTPEKGSDRYKKISFDERGIEAFFVDQFLRTYRPRRPKQLIIDLDATDDRLHGHQEARFFHGYYNCYCYLPLYIFCEDHLLAVKLRPADTDASEGALEEIWRIIAQIRWRWPGVRIILRADSGFCREQIMGWCEQQWRIQYLFGMAKNKRLMRELAPELQLAKISFELTGTPTRRFTEFRYRTKKSWSAERRLIGKAEYLGKGANPRFVVTSIPAEELGAQELYEELYCARGEMENRIKEQQLYLFADRTSSATLRANQLRVWFAAVAYLLLSDLRRRALGGTEFARAQCHTIRLKLLKIGAQVRVSVRRITVSLASGYPYQHTFARILATLTGASPQRC